ncbi:TetR/AcrR family transcriptional regulator [Kitasatospora aureofaciens]|uniref:TetR/AcrR family transcriptional regulator n=1 Tax=Kitasatospora aureofaciens TaxID=1894 RepID=UPI003824876F
MDSAPTTPEQRAYHHGNLREALVQAGVELAREGGPSTIVLRETARRVGVSPNAAYRHFSALPDLIDEVALEARRRLAEAMDAELSRCEPTGDAGADAVSRLAAVGRGYIRYALAEPGLFATAFPGCRPRAAEPTDPAPTVAARRGPFAILQEALTAIDAAHLLADPVETATLNAWAGVHGLSLLLLGPRAELSEEEREAAITHGVAFAVRGLTLTAVGRTPVRRR